MFIMWGYDKTVESLGCVGEGYCYDCRKTRSWIIAKETEWVVLYEIRTIPFFSKYHFVCERCGDDVGLTSKEFKAVKKQMRTAGTINGSPIHQSLLKRIEQQQLADKTEIQLNWIKASIEAERREYDNKD